MWIGNKQNVLGVIILLVMLFSLTHVQIVFADGSQQNVSYRIIAYINGNPFGVVYQNIDYTKITHLIYEEAFVTSGSNATLVDGQGAGFSLLMNIDNDAKSINHNIKCMISLAGGDWNSHDAGNLTTILANGTLRGELVTNIATLVSKYALDGVDIDYEGDNIVEADYLTLLSALRIALPNKIISVTGTGAYSYHIWYTPATISSYVNFVNIMMYNISTLPAYAAYSDTVTDLNQWLIAGFASSQLNLGIPITWTDANGEEGGYCQVISQFNPDVDLNELTEPTANAFSGNNLAVADGVMWFNGANLAVQKADLVESDALGGMMLWAEDYDAIGSSKSILTSVYNTLNQNTSVPISVITSSLPTCTMGVAYSQVFMATGGIAPYTWAIISGTLPAGLSLSSSGIISGTPTALNAVGTTSITFQVTDTVDATANVSLTINVEYSTWDINGDGSVNVLDRILIAQDFGRTGPPGWIREDVNDDGMINILDLIVVGQHLTG